MLAEYAKFAIEGLVHKGIRSLLTMTGIFIGIAAVVSLISLGQGLEDAINSQFAQVGSDVIFISPGESMFDVGTSSKLTDKDVEVVERVKGMDLVVPLAMKIAKVEYGNEIIYTYIAGVPTDENIELLKTMEFFKIYEGRWIKQNDRYKANLGYRFTVGDVFDKPVKTRDRVKIDGTTFEVVGSMESVGNSQDDQNVYIPLDAALDLFDIDNYMVIYARGKPGIDFSNLAEDIKKDLRKSRDVKEGEEDFSVETSESLMETMGTILDIIQWILIGVSMISLVVGGVGIMNTMYTSVLERTREIGVMKAIGARNNDILTIFLVEAGVLGMIGGIIGCVIGITMSKSVELAIAASGNPGLLQAHISAQLILGALAFSFIVGCISGVLPARHAAKLKPVDALRYE
ncbi:MAG: ABC transporter permease [Candidatus Altiarchaeota archaeon]